jgi:hypothetical protein
MIVLSIRSKVVLNGLRLWVNGILSGLFVATKIESGVERSGRLLMHRLSLDVVVLFLHFYLSCNVNFRLAEVDTHFWYISNHQIQILCCVIQCHDVSKPGSCTRGANNNIVIVWVIFE